MLLLTKIGIEVNHTSGGSGLFIVQAVIKTAIDYPTVLIGKNTDLIVIALHHFTNKKALYLTSAEVLNIGHAKQVLGEICHDILVIHAFSRCDTTSRIHSVGKPAVLHKYRKSNQFQQLTAIVLDPSANNGNIINACEQLMLSIT